MAAGMCPQSRHRENRKWCLTIRPRSLFLMIYFFSSQVCPLRFPHTSETALPLVSGEGLNMDLWLTFYIQTTTPAFWPNRYETMWFDEYENWFLQMLAWAFASISSLLCVDVEQCLLRMTITMSHYYRHCDHLWVTLQFMPVDIPS